MMKKALLQYLDGKEWETIGEVEVIDGSELEQESEGFGEWLSARYETITLPITNLDWNETWLIAYQARMYAEHFKS